MVYKARHTQGESSQGGWGEVIFHGEGVGESVLGMVTAQWGSPWYRDGHKKGGSVVGEGVTNDEWRVGLFEICCDTLTCRTQDVVPCCPPSVALLREICCGQCEEFGGNAHALTGEDPDEATKYYVPPLPCCFDRHEPVCVVHMWPPPHHRTTPLNAISL